MFEADRVQIARIIIRYIGFNLVLLCYIIFLIETTITRKKFIEKLYLL